MKHNSEDRLMFLREFRQLEEGIVTYLADNKILPGKVQINNLLTILNKSREDLINLASSSEISEVIFNMGENEKINIRINKGEIGDWSYLFDEKIEKLQILNGFYKISEEVISEKIELELWKAQMLGGIPIYCDLAEIFLPQMNENKCQKSLVADQRHDVCNDYNARFLTLGSPPRPVVSEHNRIPRDYQSQISGILLFKKMYVGMIENINKRKVNNARTVYSIDEKNNKIINKTEWDREVYFETKDYSMREAVEDADSFVGDVFFAKNSENYPLFETVIPIVSQKYVKMICQQKKKYEMQQSN